MIDSGWEVIASFSRTDNINSSLATVLEPSVTSHLITTPFRLSVTGSIVISLVSYPDISPVMSGYALYRRETLYQELLPIFKDQAYVKSPLPPSASALNTTLSPSWISET